MITLDENIMKEKPSCYGNTASTEKNTLSYLDDDALLASMGYEKKLHRGLSALSNFAFGFTEVAVLASITSLYGYGLQTGGE
jgi:hypothetical protein